MLREFTKTKFNISSKTSFREDVGYHTRKIPCFSDDPSRHIVTHFEALRDSALKRGNSTLGSWFECCVIDALLVFVSSTGKHIDSSRLMLGVDIHPPFNAEIDILIKPTLRGGQAYFLFVKTSFRERWKQPDRDAIVASFARRSLIANTEKYEAIAFFYREHEPDTLEMIKHQAENIKGKVHSIHHVISAKDSIETLALFDRIANSLVLCIQHILETMQI